MKTAVEWLHEKLAQSSQEELVGNINLWFQQAKEMEKQQIIDAHGNKEKKSGGITNYTYILTGEDYYNEVYKKN